ncbi:GNAT family N-acetyltransferase, partial [bacterium]|nr:GNAT family N-acetyltransferase [bacterium]
IGSRRTQNNKELMIQFKRLTLEKVKWEELDRFWDRTVFETLPWLRFLEKTQSAEPVIAAIEHSGELIGYFTGLIVRKYGVKILGSPFKGWTTSFMGFNLLHEYNRWEFLKDFPSFVLDQLKCHYFEISDRYIKEEDYVGLGYTVLFFKSYEIDLTKSEEELFANMKKKCRKAVRKATRNGIYIEQATDMGFVDDYYDQLTDVFAKQSLVPTYPKTRVQELIIHLLPRGNLLLLRVRNKDGLCIATGIHTVFNESAYGWGGASWREYQMLQPNELLEWNAMKSLKARGIKRYDMVGPESHKRKYGGDIISVPRLIMGKYGFLFDLRNLAKKAAKARQSLLGHTNR